MPDPTDVEIGDKVSYYTDEGIHRALVLDDCEGDEFITVVYGADAQLGMGYNYQAEDQSSVFPHKKLDPDEYTAETVAFTPGWKDADEYIGV